MLDIVAVAAGEAVLSGAALVVELAQNAPPDTGSGDVLDPRVNTNFPGAAKVEELVGAIKFLALAACVAALLIGGGAWGLAARSGNASTMGRSFCLGGALGAVIVGLAPDIVTYFYA